jgi:hypothetical protein
MPLSVRDIFLGVAIGRIGKSTISRLLSIELDVERYLKSRFSMASLGTRFRCADGSMIVEFECLGWFPVALCPGSASPDQRQLM